MLAIVIPYYKREFFQETLGSLANQSNKQFHVYIGNDASPEDPDDLIDSFRNDLDLTYCRFQKNLGKISLTRQWDRCISMIGSERWIMLLGDDDILSPGTIEAFYVNLEGIMNANVHVVRFATQEINGFGEKISGVYKFPVIQNYADVFYNRFFSKSRSSISEHIFSRSQYSKIGFRDLPYAWHADDLAWLEFSEFGKIYTINEVVVFFRISRFNISRPNYLIKEKRIGQYLFFTIVVNEYLHNFRRKYQIILLKKYELMTYALRRKSFRLGLSLFFYMCRYGGIKEALKFSRRWMIIYR